MEIKVKENLSVKQRQMLEISKYNRVRTPGIYRIKVGSDILIVSHQVLQRYIDLVTARL
jgi:hypothetical protein